MLKRYIIILLSGLFIVTSGVNADEITLGEYDSIVRVLSSHMGQRVTIKLISGQELSGTVTNVTDFLTHLSQLTGMEFYDAVIENDDITAVIVRVRQ